MGPYAGQLDIRTGARAFAGLRFAPVGGTLLALNTILGLGEKNCKRTRNRTPMKE